MIRGRSIAAEHFKVRDVENRKGEVPFLETLRGEVPGFRIRGFLDREAADTIAMNYARHPSLVERENVPATQLGLNAYDLDRLSLPATSYRATAAVNELFIGLRRNPDTSLSTFLQQHTPADTPVRPSVVLGTPLPTLRAMEWRQPPNDNETMALSFHEDTTQLRGATGINGTELSEVQNVVALNIYPATPRSGQVWPRASSWRA